VKPSYSGFVMAAFEAVFLPWRRRRLDTRLAGAVVPADGRPVVMVANHVSWWDGFLLRDVHRLLAGARPLFTIMREDELRRHGFLRRIGAVGFDPDRPATIRDPARALEERARHEDIWVSFFPQGRIRPSWARPLGFAPGIDFLLRRIGPATVLPIGLHLEPLSRVAPTAFVSVGAALSVQDDGTRHDLEQAVTLELDRIQSFIRIHGEETPARWPATMERLPAPDGAAARGVRGGDT